MNDRFVAPVALRLVAGAILALAAAPAFAQATKAASASEEWSQPRTPWGDPDLQGTWTSDNCIRTPMNRPAEFGDRLYLTAEEIAQREAAIEAQKVTDAKESAEGQAVRTGPPPHWGERARKSCGQTSLVVDPPNGRVPDMLPEAKTRVIPQAATIENPRADTWEDFQDYIRCITRGVTGSIFPVIYGNGQQVVQGPGYVMIMQEMVHEARVIPLDGRPHVSRNIRSYMGDPRGHWEGDTLVVETTNFKGGATGTGNNGGGTPTTDALKLVERYTRTGPNDMRYEVTIDDPKTYVRPYKVAFPLTQEPGYQNFEYACHEGNYGMYDSLSGARAKEREAKEKAEKAAAADAAVKTR
jgi:hypothetical protein